MVGNSLQTSETSQRCNNLPAQGKGLVVSIDLFSFSFMPFSYSGVYIDSSRAVPISTVV